MNCKTKTAGNCKPKTTGRGLMAGRLSAPGGLFGLRQLAQGFAITN